MAPESVVFRSTVGVARCLRRAAWVLAIFSLVSAVSLRAESEFFGRILDPVICAADPTQTYVLYVPSSYTSERKWPVIFCFDASARGRMPVERLQAAAEQYGYLVAGSLNSRNGPWTENAKAVQAMVRDVSAHFSVDPQRIYTTGVSGGARVATSLALSGLAKGVIACAAGFPVLTNGIPPKVPFVFFGTTGTEDFNYAELMRLDADLEQRQAVHRIVVFQGGHEWAPAALFTEAVEWLDLQAMRLGTREKNEDFVRTQFAGRVAAVPAAAGTARWKALKSVAADFQGLTDTSDLERQVKELGGTRAVKEELKAERTLATREDDLVAELGGLAAEGAAQGQKFAAQLRKQADAPDDTPERRMVRRAIASFCSMTRETVRPMFEQKEYEKAAGFLELAAALRPEQKATWFDLARARAAGGDRKPALTAFERAVALGFNDTVRVEAEPAFAWLRSDPRFKAAAAQMQTTVAEPAIVLPTMRVGAALANVELRLFYLPNVAGATQSLSFLSVETVRPNSLAAAAGLEERMEVTAIQGVHIRGLTEEDLNKIMAQPVKTEIVITARKTRSSTEKEIRIPLRKVLPATAENRGK
jgi:predicted esterase